MSGAQGQRDSPAGITSLRVNSMERMDAHVARLTSLQDQMASNYEGPPEP